MYKFNMPHQGSEIYDLVDHDHFHVIAKNINKLSGLESTKKRILENMAESNNEIHCIDAYTLLCVGNLGSIQESGEPNCVCLVRYYANGIHSILWNFGSISKIG